MWSFAVSMNWMDVVVLVFLAFGILKGLKTGLVSQVLIFVSAVIGLRLALDYCLPVAEVAQGFLPFNQGVMVVLAFVATYVLVMLAAKLIVGIWRDLTKDSAVSWLDSFGGGVLGGLRVLVVGAVVVYLLSLVPIGAISGPASGSALMELVGPATQDAWERLPELKELMDTGMKKVGVPV